MAPAASTLHFVMELECWTDVAGKFHSSFFWGGGSADGPDAFFHSMLTQWIKEYP